MANIGLGLVLVLYKAFCFLVNGIVGQVHAQIVEVAPLWRHIVFCRKPCESFFVNESSQGVDTGYQNVNPKIKLQVVN